MHADGPCIDRDDRTVTTACFGPGVKFVDVTCSTTSLFGAIVAVNQLPAPVNCTVELSVPSDMPLDPETATRAALGIALDTRKAWFNAVAARETARYMGKVKAAAEASAVLAERMAAVGNWSKLNHAREQAFYADATAQLARARAAETSARERLSRLMGLWGEDLAFQLPDRLPDLPKAPRELGPDLEAQALAQRLDVQAARRDTEALARSLGLTQVSRFVSLLDFGVHNNSETGRPNQRGWEVEIGIPIFDFGQARTARAERLYMQALSRTAETAIRARSEVREAYSAYRTNFDVAKHYRDEVVPLRKRISEEMLLRYNGMLASVFELARDDCDVRILPPRSLIEDYVRLIRGLPESAERLGEILVGCGSLSEQELAQALASQRESPPTAQQPLGEILVQRGSIHPEVLDAALVKQKDIKEARTQDSRSIRVDAEKLDQLIDGLRAAEGKQ